MRKKQNSSMNLKTRMRISFICSTLIPIVMTVIAFCLLTSYRIHSIGKQYGIEDADYSTLYNSTYLIMQTMDSEMKKIEEALEDGSSRLETTSFLNEINGDLRMSEAYLVIRRGDDITYNGSTAISDSKFLSVLPEYGSSDNDSETGVYLEIGNQQVLVRQLDFLYDDGEEGSVFMIGTLNHMLPIVRFWIIELLLCIVLILLFTSLFMSIWIYNGVIVPIQSFKKATQKIRDGDLNFNVEPTGVREFDELGRDFEEMRIRLKESAEEELKNDRENKELISNISHDLKTPVTTIKGYAEGIMDGVADTPEKKEKYLRTIYNKANDMDRLIDELTMYAKIDSNKIPYNFVRLNVAEYFDDCVSEIRVELENRGFRLNYTNNLREDVCIVADPEQLKRVINNIIGNSIKYMDKEEGIINIRLRDVGDFVQVEIEDNGSGISAEALPRIFDRFYRSDASRNSRHGGSGIGLSIVKKIIEDHDGHVWATSREGEGTVIYFMLKKYRDEEQSQAAETTGRRKQKNSHGGNFKV